MANYWLIAPYQNAKLWDEFYKKSIIGIGWDYLGNLEQYGSKDDIFGRMQREDPKKASSIDARACWEFSNVISIGDIIYAKKGKSFILGRGIVESRYIFDDERQEFKHIREVRWTHKCSLDDPFGIIKTLTNVSDKHQQIEKLEALFIERELMEMDEKQINQLAKLLKTNHNLILTGAPGTGKTFLAKQIAMQMILGFVKDEKDLTDEEKAQFNEQYKFVQFHPSYDYTDFVEGLRPTKQEINVVGFELKDGIFKSFCKKAIDAIAVESIDIFTLDSYEKYLQAIGLHEITTKNYKHRIEQLLGKELKSKKQVVDKVIYSSLDEICDSIDEIKDFDVSNNFHYQFLSAALKLISFRESLSIKKHMIDKSKKDYVFIIDEINRGEISKIFGELFFSIDPSYRGIDGKVKTQYQNMIEEGDTFYDGFYVPENVYIIGTMNDIDRSVESFDFAMRRRFTWKEITAEQSQKMFENKSWKGDAIKRMNALNDVIWKKDAKDGECINGLNSSYHIGGAYFLKLDNYNEDEQFDKLWEYHLEPLLREYLRGMSDSEKQLKKLKDAYYGKFDATNSGTDQKNISGDSDENNGQ